MTVTIKTQLSETPRLSVHVQVTLLGPRPTKNAPGSRVQLVCKIDCPGLSTLTQVGSGQEALLPMSFSRDSTKTGRGQVIVGGFPTVT